MDVIEIDRDDGREEVASALQRLGRWWRNYERFQWFAYHQGPAGEDVLLDVETLRRELDERPHGPGHREQILVKLVLKGGREAGDVLKQYDPPEEDEDLALFLDVARREWDLSLGER